jgi:hypothetical protein
LEKPLGEGLILGKSITVAERPPEQVPVDYKFTSALKCQEQQKRILYR